MVRIGILGVAHLHVDSYIDNLRAADAIVVGVSDPDLIRARSWAAAHGVPFYETVDDLLSQRLDGVLVCSETFHHRALVERAAARGCAVLCEKPLGVGQDDTARVVAACDEAGVTLMTAFPVRFHPAVRHLRGLITSGRLGAVRAMSGTNQSVMPMRERAWFVDPTLAGGGAMMDHIVHLADLFCWFTDSVPEQVYAVCNRIVHSDVVTVETSGVAMLTFADGVFASIDCSWNRPLEFHTWGGIAMSVVGDGGIVDMDPMRQRLTQYGGGRPYGWIPWGSDVNQLMINDFLAGIRERRPPSITGRDGQVATTVALAAIQSAAIGRPVPWPEATQAP